jgi:peptidoglycan/xylan/chitin deacetylase (PgdA/CDA1 family)
MLRRLAKTGIACALHWTGANRLIDVLNGSRNMPLVLGYHRVVEDYAASAGHYMPAMLISRRMLERQLDWIGRHFRFVSLDELSPRLERGEPFDKPVAAITFDDGYRDVYDHAFPLLKRKGIPAGIFVVTELVGTTRLQTYDKLYLLLARAYSSANFAPDDLAHLLFRVGLSPLEHQNMRTLARNPYTAMRAVFTTFQREKVHLVIKALETEFEVEEHALPELHQVSWDMVAEMHRAGMTIGSHSHTHAVLTNESWHTVLDETAGSRRVLERELGITIKHLAYPNGSFNATTVRAVAVSGYRFAYTTCLHRNPVYPLLTIPRKLLWENSCIDTLGRFSSPIMSCHAHGVFDLVAGCRQDHGI